MSTCPGQYCGRTILDSNNTLSDCGVCKWGTRVNDLGICTPCDLTPTLYDWLYLGFMAFLPFLHHCSFIKLSAIARQSRAHVYGSQVASSAVECVLAALFCLLIVEPVGTLQFHTCGVRRLEDWYTVFYNPVIDYKTTIHCTQEAVYPLYFLPFLYYMVSLVLLAVARPLVLWAFKVKIADASDAIYAALYFYPALIFLHALLSGIIYFSFPFVLILAAICLNAVHLTLYPIQSVRTMLKCAWESRQRKVIILTLIFLYTDAILSMNAFMKPWWGHFAYLLIPIPTVFYLLTVRFTNPSNLNKVN